MKIGLIIKMHVPEKREECNETNLVYKRMKGFNNGDITKDLVVCVKMALNRINTDSTDIARIGSS